MTRPWMRRSLTAGALITLSICGARAEELATTGIWTAATDGGAYADVGVMETGKIAFALPANSKHFVLDLTRSDWSTSIGTEVILHVIFSGGDSFAFHGVASGDRIKAEVPDDQVASWTHNFTARTLMMVSFQGLAASPWSIPLSGTTPTVTAMAKALNDAGISDLPPPWSTSNQTKVSGVAPSPSTAPEPPLSVATPLGLPGTLTGQDIPRLEREFDASSEAFANAYLGKAFFSDVGSFQEFTRVELPQPLWMVLVNLVGGQAFCFYDHVDATLARMNAGQVVRISGTVAMPIKAGIGLAQGCSVAEDHPTELPSLHSPATMRQSTSSAPIPLQKPSAAPSQATATAPSSLLYDMFHAQTDEEKRKAQEDRNTTERAEATKTAAAATRMGVSVDTYLWGKDHAGTPYILCKDLVIDNARYGGRSDWLPTYSWSVSTQRMITIIGQDVRLKNAFNAEEYFVYKCLASLKLGYENGAHSDVDISAWSVDVVEQSPLRQ